MAISIHDNVGTVQAVAPAGGVTIRTPYFDATNRILLIPLETAASGVTYTALTGESCKRLKGVTAYSTAWTAGQAIAWASTASSFIAFASGSAYVVVGHAAADRAAAVLTGDVDLCPQVTTV